MNNNNKKKQPVLRSLRTVKEFFPGVTRIDDGVKQIIIEVTAKDQTDSVVQSHTNCAYAVACKRQLKADGVLMGTKTTYVIFGKRAYRYRVNESVAREIVSFDRDAGFDSGKYVLRPPAKSERLGAKRAMGSRTVTGEKAKRFRHITKDIRTILGRHATTTK